MALIEVKDAIKTYQTGEDSFNALNCVSLSVDEGEFVAIMGASGSGKSTFMNMLGTLDKPNSGSYYLDGIDMLHLTPNEVAEIRNSKMGFVFQGFNLIARTTALENVELPMIYKGIPEDERIKRAKHALKIVGLEPTGNLDTKTSIEVMEFFVNLNEKTGKTIILVTHEPDIAEYCKRVVRFKDGNIISDEVKRK